MLFAPISGYAADENEGIDNTGSTIESIITDTQTGTTIETTLVENTGSNLIETIDSATTVSTDSTDINISTGELTPVIESN
jgi:hypothetical protein